MFEAGQKLRIPGEGLQEWVTIMSALPITRGARLLLLDRHGDLLPQPVDLPEAEFESVTTLSLAGGTLVLAGGGVFARVPAGSRSGWMAATVTSANSTLLASTALSPFVHRSNAAHGATLLQLRLGLLLADEREAASARLTMFVKGVGLQPKSEKTRIVRLLECELGFDLLALHHRLLRPRPRRGIEGRVLLSRWPSSGRYGTTPTASSSSRCGLGWFRRPNKWWESSTSSSSSSSSSSSAAGPGSYVSGTRPRHSTRSGFTPWLASPYLLPSITSAAGHGGSRRSSGLRVASAWSPSMASSSLPGRIGSSGLRPTTAGEGRR